MSRIPSKGGEDERWGSKPNKSEVSEAKILYVEFGRVCQKLTGKVSDPCINQMGASKLLIDVQLQLCSYRP